MKKQMIFTNDIYKAFGLELEYLVEGNEELSEEQLTELAYELIDEQYQNLLSEIKENGNFLISANIGCWNGRQYGYAFRESLDGAIELAIRGCGTINIYIDEKEGLVVEGRHHDGVNYYTIREMKSNTNMEKLNQRIESGKHTINLKNYSKRITSIY